MTGSSNTTPITSGGSAKLYPASGIVASRVGCACAGNAHTSRPATAPASTTATRANRHAMAGYSVTTRCRVCRTA